LEVSVAEIRAVRWNDDALVLIDQTQLPATETYMSCTQVDQVVDAIVRLVVREAPLLGAVGEYGVAIALLQD